MSEPLMDKNSFLKYTSPFEDSNFLILPIPYEQTTSYGTGTRNGPDAIIKASHYLEVFDEELGIEPYLEGINTLEPLDFETRLIEPCIEKIYKTVQALPIKEKFLLSLGGEHSITYPIVRAFKEKFNSITVLQIDAHSDLREEYEGTIYSHACVMARVKDMANIVQVGIRSQTREEYDLIKKIGIHTFYMSSIIDNKHWKEQVLESLGENVYLTVDLDGFDPSIAPAVGTPEPGGLLWYDVVNLIKMVAHSRNIIGCDIVELSPRPGSIVTDFLAAKLAYKIIAYHTR
ncbi:MAG: agmatinase [bacterium]